MNTDQEDHELACWVAANVRPGDKWLWTPKQGWPVTMQIQSYTVGGAKGQGQYEVRFKHLFVDTDLGPQLYLPQFNAPRLPEWFKREIASRSPHAPYCMWSGAFRTLVQSGIIVACK